MSEIDNEVAALEDLVEAIWNRVVDERDNPTADCIIDFISAYRSKPVSDVHAELLKESWVVEKYDHKRKAWDQIGPHEKTLRNAFLMMSGRYRTGMARRSKFRILKITERAIEVNANEYIATT